MRYILFLIVSAAVLTLLPDVVSAGSVGDWEGRRIYQIMTDRFAQTTYDPHAPCNMNQYCGGTFKGAQNQLDYISGMGFDAIWISPVPVNYHEGYHGYWATDFFKINPHFGTPAALKSFIDAAHSKGIWIMMDIVVNHVGPVGTDYTNVHPFNKSEYYHTQCAVTQYICETEQVQVCRLADLPDLNQTHPFVKAQLTSYVKWLLDDFGFDGIRADTVMYIDNQYWKDLQTAIGAPGSANSTYMVGEVWSSFSCNLNYTKDGIDATLNYPLYDTLRNVFQHPSTSMRHLGTYWRQQATLPRPNAEVNFIDNQDNNRFLHDSSATIPLYTSALVHLYFTNGIPCVFYGTEQLYSGSIDGNFCRRPLWWSQYNNQTTMYKFLTTLNSIHKTHEPWKHQVLERWQDSDLYCFARGQLLVCTTNQVTSQSRSIPNLPWQAGTKVCNLLLGSGGTHCYTAASTMSITLPAGGSPVILGPQ